MDGEGKRGGRRKEEGNEEMRKDGGAGVSKAEGKEERRKAGDNPWELSKSDVHLCLNLRVSFCVVNYFPCISFFYSA